MEMRPSQPKLTRNLWLGLQGKAKKNAWQKLVDEGVTPEQAQEKYVKKIESMKETYGYDENKDRCRRHGSAQPFARPHVKQRNPEKGDGQNDHE